MFEKTSYQCPNCKAVIRQELENGGEFTCVSCRKCFRVMLDSASGKAGFIEADAARVPEPLYLPKGSIRAIVTIAMTLSCWILIFAGKDVPNYLFGLILAIIGYYFGFRQKIKASQSRIFDASAKAEEPLSLPQGCIRFFLIAGFFVCGLVLHFTGRLKNLSYLEFFVILFGLILGYIFAKVLAKFGDNPLYRLLNHVKGVAVLVAALCLAVLLISGSYVNYHYPALLLSAAVSFYFGSRS